MTVTGQHPGDSEPDPSWPPTKAATGRLETVRRFLNTTNLQSGFDRLATPEDLERWATDNGLAHLLDERLDQTDLADMIAFREAVRGLALQNHHSKPDDAVLLQWSAAVAAARLSVASDGQRMIALVPVHLGSRGLIEYFTAIVVESAIDRSWPRMKACSSGTCQWVFFDHSKNRSGLWCSMDACGSREKARRYRGRIRAEGEGGT